MGATYEAAAHHELLVSLDADDDAIAARGGAVAGFKAAVGALADLLVVLDGGVALGLRRDDRRQWGTHLDTGDLAHPRLNYAAVVVHYAVQAVAGAAHQMLAAGAPVHVAVRCGSFETLPVALTNGLGNTPVGGADGADLQQQPADAERVRQEPEKVGHARGGRDGRPDPEALGAVGLPHCSATWVVGGAGARCVRFGFAFSSLRVSTDVPLGCRCVHKVNESFRVVVDAR
ncbi:glycosyltransferase [Babesia caballi]|uniref:Glycosyltransferase n=1 Tax=Babesia caballi TaxID=5871 RepID=A0AAV4LWY0_BABCB|nr:glycosyltransferase [Babesia caballi]